MITFKEFLKEKVSINSEWMSIKLPSGAEIHVSIKLLAQNKIEISRASDHRSTEIDLGDNAFKSLQDAIGEELDTESSDIKKLMQVIGDCQYKKG